MTSWRLDGTQRNPSKLDPRSGPTTFHVECWSSYLGRLGQTFLLFGRGTGPKRSGAVLACFWTDFQPEPSILDPIRAVFDDFDPNRHFGLDLARPGTGRKALRPAQGLAGRPWPSPYFFFSVEIKKAGLSLFSEGGRLPPSEKKCFSLFREKKKYGLGQGLPASPWAGPKASRPVPGLAKSRPKCRFGPKSSKTTRIGSRIDGSG